AEQPRFTYTARELDSDTGLYYYRARWYDAATGKFMSEDPIDFAGGDENLYRYCANNPLLLSDPSGLKWIVRREGRETAECCRENAGDSKEMLAKQIGLDPKKIGAWLTEKGGRFFVPNTIYALWAGDDVARFSLFGIEINLGKGAVDWYPDMTYLRNRGFKVDEVDVWQRGWKAKEIRESVDLGPQYGPFRGWERIRFQSDQKVLDLIGNASKNGELHGLFYWGHGAPDFIGTKDASWFVTYYDIVQKLNYRMAFVMLNACFSGYQRGEVVPRYFYPIPPYIFDFGPGRLVSGGRDLAFSDRYFFGVRGVLNPFNRLPIFKTKLPELPFKAASHPFLILPPGAQETKR
ncbi:MAG: RHS repeat-associated core domain-containing protein, partial [Pirellulales bacterium]